MDKKYYKLLGGSLPEDSVDRTHLSKGLTFLPEAKDGTEVTFSDIENVTQFINYGVDLYEVNIPDGVCITKYGYTYTAPKVTLKHLGSILDIKWIKFLKENGADITFGDNYLIRLGAYYNRLDLVKYLHENGADITIYNNDPIGIAAENGYIEMVKYLHENGADITARNNFALQWATLNNHKEVQEYLKANGATEPVVRYSHYRYQTDLTGKMKEIKS